MKNFLFRGKRKLNEELRIGQIDSMCRGRFPSAKNGITYEIREWCRKYLSEFRGDAVFKNILSDANEMNDSGGGQRVKCTADSIS